MSALNSCRLVTLLELLELRAEPFWRLSNLTGQLLIRLETSLPDIGQIAGILYELRTEAGRLGARSAAAQVDRISEFVRSDEWNRDLTILGATLHQLVKDLHYRMIDDLKGQFFLSVPADKVTYYQQDKLLFGNDVHTQFPSASFEMDEAGKCIALCRYTAAIFHLMRIMEISIRATARCLGIPDPVKPGDRNWGNILKDIKAGIDAKWPTQTARQSGDGHLFENIYASLDAVRNPWRNATMHVENKYTEEEAEHIFLAVRGFMIKLSARLDEQGLPLA